MGGYINLYDNGIILLFLAGAYVLLDILFDFIGIPYGLEDSELLYIIFKLGIGYIIAQIFIRRTGHPSNKYQKQGTIK